MDGVKELSQNKHGTTEGFRNGDSNSNNKPTMNSAAQEHE